MILAIDTATRVISMALHDGERILREVTWHSKGHHTVELVPAIERMMTQSDVVTARLAAVAVPTGPGSYTGLRIGMSVAKGIALAQTPPLPLIGIPTLNILAAAQPRLTKRLCVVTQAGRKRVNAGFYHWTVGGWMGDGDPLIATWDELIEQLTADTQVAGEIDARGRDLLDTSPAMRALPVHGLRRAGYLAELAYVRLRQGDVDDSATLAPFYLR